MTDIGAIISLRCTLPGSPVRIIYSGGLMNIKIFAAIVGLSVSSAAMPQSALIDMPDFRPLESKAKDCVNISLGPWLLHSLGLFLDEKDPDTAATKELLRGIESIQVR